MNLKGEEFRLEYASIVHRKKYCEFLNPFLTTLEAFAFGMNARIYTFPRKKIISTWCKNLFSLIK